MIDFIPNMLIIGDIGSNWHSKDDCINSIKALAKAGAHYAKFQYFTYEKLYGIKSADLSTDIPSSWIPELAQVCKDNGIQFMCSVFSPSDVEYLNKYVYVHKVASAEINHTEMLKELAKTKKLVLCSTGCASGSDITNAHRILKDNFAPMACTMEYPASNQPVRSLAYLLRHNGGNVSYSDHSLDLYAGPYIAFTSGCIFYERHFRLNEISDTPDAGHALTPEQFADMCHFINILGTDDMHWQENKSEHKRVHGPLGCFRPEPFC
jgi:sialic acid synthase SpsE